VRFALEQQPVLEPFAESVNARFESWLTQKATAGISFNADKRTWLELIRDHVATSLSIETEDFEYAPFSQRGGLGRVAQIFGEKLADTCSRHSRSYGVQALLPTLTNWSRASTRKRMQPGPCRKRPIGTAPRFGRSTRGFRSSDHPCMKK